ncbi:MAG: HlyD family secretion protein [Gammaproteobacteria bacterium]|nr:HlyD family secretion protein [Gammaproteobacteria bacterium]
MQFTLRHSLKLLIWLTIIALLVAGSYFFWRYEMVHPSTEDAYVNANIINIAAQVSGPIATIDTQNHAFVNKGQLLFSIDTKPFVIAVQQAQAELDNVRQQAKALQEAIIAANALVTERQSELVDTQKDAHRILTLVRKGVLPISDGDSIKSKLQVAEAALKAAQSNFQEAQQQLGTPGEDNAQIRTAKAALNQALLNLQHTKITAPASGQIINFTLRKGSMIPAQQAQFALIENNRWWVDANFKETDLGRLKIGQKALITVDMYPDRKFQGQIVNISGGSGAAFSLLPPEDATGNWIKVTQRFPVKIRFLNLDPKYPLRVGASSKVIVDTKK